MAYWAHHGFFLWICALSVFARTVIDMGSEGENAIAARVFGLVCNVGRSDRSTGL